MIDKEKIFEKLKEQYEKNSQISSRTINEVLETLIPTVAEDTSEEDFLKIANPVFETIAGNVRKDVADTIKKFKEENKPTPKDDSDSEKDDSEKDKTESYSKKPEWLDAFTSKFEAYDRAFKDLEERKKTEQVRKEALEKVKIYPDSVVDVASDGFDFGQDDAIDAFIEKAGRIAGKFNIVPERGEAKQRKPKFNKLLEELERNDELLGNNN